MFDKLSDLAKSEGITFSVYVDDISFSSNKIISHNFLKKTFAIIKNNGFEISKNKDDKRKFYRGKIGINSIITGIRITNEGMFITKKREEKIEKQLEDLKNLKNESPEFKKVYDSVFSSIQQAILVNLCYEDYLNKLKIINI